MESSDFIAMKRKGINTTGHSPPERKETRAPIRLYMSRRSGRGNGESIGTSIKTIFQYAKIIEHSLRLKAVTAAFVLRAAISALAVRNESATRERKREEERTLCLISVLSSVVARKRETYGRVAPPRMREVYGKAAFVTKG